LSVLAGFTTDRLHEGLDFGPTRNTANYMLDRKEVTIYPQSGGVFSNQGIRALRFSFAHPVPSFVVKR
jgi:hypothetical protein